MDSKYGICMYKYHNARPNVWIIINNLDNYKILWTMVLKCMKFTCSTNRPIGKANTWMKKQKKKFQNMDEIK